jgi:D-glycero-D-manno-heptose 1,7-bisphosphate phosphatase
MSPDHIPAASPRRGAVIFDRDGVLNEDVAYAHRPDQIRWVDGAISAVKAVNAAGLFAFVATNQSGIARGLYTEADVVHLHDWMNGELARFGARIDAFVYSPYHPDGVVEAYQRASSCRKPGPGMILDLMARFPVDRARTLMIGDQPTDVEAARAAGVQGLLFNGGSVLAAITPWLNDLAERSGEVVKPLG